MKNIILIMGQLFLLMIIHELGVMIANWFNLPIPGNVLGMILLFFLLWSRIIRLQWIEKAAAILTKHLAFFFIPISVGMMTLGSFFLNSGFIMVIILFISTVIGLLFSGTLSQLLIAKKEKMKIGSHHHSL